jgi:hypothetical protein
VQHIPVRVGFHATVKRRVHQYFVDNRLPTTGDWRLFLKTGMILLWFVLFYMLYVFCATSLPMSLLTVMALAQGFILIGFNMMHDGGHRSFSRQKAVNGIMGFTLDLNRRKSRPVASEAQSPASYLYQLFMSGTLIYIPRASSASAPSNPGIRGIAGNISMPGLCTAC